MIPAHARAQGFSRPTTKNRHQALHLAPGNTYSTSYSSTVQQPQKHLLLLSPVLPWLPDSSCCDRYTRLGHSLTAAASRQDQEQRRQSRPRRGNAVDDDDDDDDLDPEEEAKLRKLLKGKGKTAVDENGILTVPVDSGAAPGAPTAAAAAASSRPRRQHVQRQADHQHAGVEEQFDMAGAASSPAYGGTSSKSSGSGSSSSSARPKLFDSSKLQAAAPGSAGTKPALPIVRPSSGDTSSSTGSSSSSSSSTRGGRQQRGSTRSSIPAAAFFSRQSWQDLGASADLAAALQSLGITQPSHIQSEAFKALNPKSGHKHVAVADQAGSGKTLAYLLPLLQQLKLKEAAAGGACTVPNSPYMIVMTPTAELAQQVGRVVRALSAAGLRVRSTVMTGGQGETDRRSKTFRTQCELLDGGVDVIIATPGRLMAHLDKGSLKLNNTAALILDEVDVLAGGEVSYGEHIAPLRAAAGAGMRCVLVSATLPQHTFDELQDLFVDLGAAFGPGLHRTATGLIEELVDCSGGEEVSLESGTQRKLEALQEALNRVRSPRTVVFCNKIETCRVVENALKRAAGQYKVVAYHEAIREDLRSASLTSWLTSPAVGQPPMVLVCTDRTSRGIDSMWCEHVVLFEFPRDPSEYVRRVGRTARGAGGRGVVTVLVLGKQVSLAKDILARNKEGAPVHKVPRLWKDDQ